MRKFLLVLLFSSVANGQIAKGILSKDFSLSRSNFAVVPFSATEFETEKMLASDGSFRALKAGTFFFWAQVTFGPSCNGTRRTAAFLRNGNGWFPFGRTGLLPPFVCNESVTLQLHGFTKLNAGEFVTLNVFQDAEPFLSIDAFAGGSATTWLTVIRLE